MTPISNFRIHILYLNSVLFLRHWQMIEIITYYFDLSGYYEIGHTAQQYMHCFPQKRTRPPFNSGWILLLRIKRTYDKCIIWNTVTKYVIVWRFLCEKWKQIKYLTTSLSSFSVLSMLFIESHLLPQFMYDGFLFHINQYSKLYNHKDTTHHFSDFLIEWSMIICLLY